jgi:ABC-type tungstate transport system substrate-binding protein
MIFRVIRVYKNVQNGTSDPTGFGCDQLMDMVKGFFIPFLIIGLLVLVLFALLGFSGILGIGPLGFFRVVFWLGLVVFSSWSLISWVVISIARNFLTKMKKVTDDTLYRDVTPQ